MSLVGFQANNHPQQTAERGPDDAVDDRATDPVFFAMLNERFAFTLDVAASADNTKCAEFYDRDDNGLLNTWGGASVWCNPPYSTIRPWVEKAWQEWRGCRAIVMLLPANRTEQSWWQQLVEPYRDRPGSSLTVEFLPGRLRFLKPNQKRIGPNERPPFGSCLLIWTSPEFSSRRKERWRCEPL